MDYTQAVELLRQFQKPFVRIDPRGSNAEARKHHTIGRMISVSRRHAIVIPMKHKQPEQIELRYLKEWRSARVFLGRNCV